ncbi:MAG: GDSL-type esterase/lipase family protein [Sandaracinus sp.]
MERGRVVGTAIVACLAAIAWAGWDAAPRAIAQDAAPSVTIEDPLNIVVPRIRAALAQSHDRLVRLSFWGASHTASDQYTGMLRARLQARYGDGGPGAFMPAPPAAFYERRDVSLAATSGFSGIEAVSATRVSPLGAMGMALDARSNAMARFTVLHDLHAHIRVFARAHPLRDGATARVSIRHGRAVVEREMASNADATLELDADVTSHEPFELRASRARVFGVSVEARTGVVVDSFGVSGARAEHAERWDDESFQSSVRALAPDVVFLAYGTNESSGTHPVAEHGRALESLIDRMRRAAPRAPCVVIGPSNYPIQRGGEWVVRPRSAEVRGAFRAAAIGRGCGYVDLIAFQGGESNLDAWVSQDLVLGDHVHMTDAGHERLAAALERAIVGP